MASIKSLPTDPESTARLASGVWTFSREYDADRCGEVHTWTLHKDRLHQKLIQMRLPNDQEEKKLYIDRAFGPGTFDAYTHRAEHRWYSERKFIDSILGIERETPNMAFASITTGTTTYYNSTTTATIKPASASPPSSRYYAESPFELRYKRGLLHELESRFDAMATSKVHREIFGA